MSWTLLLSTYLDQGTSDGVASGLANRVVKLRSGNAGEESNNGGLGEHVDDWYYVINVRGATVKITNVLVDFFFFGLKE